MKTVATTFLICISVCFVSIVNAQITSNCNPKPFLISEYQKDIKTLAVDLLWNKGIDTDAVEIPKVYTDLVTQKLAAIHNITSSQRDTIFNNFCVHNNRDIYNQARYAIYLDTTFTWTMNWVNGDSLTQNTAIDTFLSNYKFDVYGYTLDEFSLDPNYRHRIYISANEIYNADAVVDYLKAIPGVADIFADELVGVAGEITLNQVKDTTFFTFKLEWNSCLDGCDDYITWTFGVDTNCNVFYTERNEFHLFSTFAPPVANYCETTFTKIESLTPPDKWRVFPNPSNGKISFLNLDQEATIEVVDLSGRLLFSKVKQPETDEINMPLLQGLYLLKVTSMNQHYCQLIQILN